MAGESDEYASGFGLVIVVKYGDKEVGKACKSIDKKGTEHEQVYEATTIDVKTPGKSDQELVKCDFKDKRLKSEKEEYGFPCVKKVEYGEKEIIYRTDKSSWKQGY